MSNQPANTQTLQSTEDAPGAIDGKFFTVSNALSLSRIVLAIPFALVMLSDSPNASIWGIVILAVAALTDKFDGVLARKYHQVTEWGKILDPVADKIGMGIVALVLVRVELIPLWFVLLLIGRDLLILAGGVHVKRTKGTVLQSNQLGKWTIGVLAITMFCAMLRQTLAADIFLWLSVAMLCGSLALYVKRFAAEMRPSQSTNI